MLPSIHLPLRPRRDDDHSVSRDIADMIIAELKRPTLATVFFTSVHAGMFAVHDIKPGGPLGTFAEEWIRDVIVTRHDHHVDMNRSRTIYEIDVDFERSKDGSDNPMNDVSIEGLVEVFFGSKYLGYPFTRHQPKPTNIGNLQHELPLTFERDNVEQMTKSDSFWRRYFSGKAAFTDKDSPAGDYLKYIGEIIVWQLIRSQSAADFLYKLWLVKHSPPKGEIPSLRHFVLALRNGERINGQGVATVAMDAFMEHILLPVRRMLLSYLSDAAKMSFLEGSTGYPRREQASPFIMHVNCRFELGELGELLPSFEL